MATDESIQDTIRRLVEEEHALRDPAEPASDDAQGRVERLQQIEVELDQCWDLLRQRDALRATGGDPDDAQVRPASQVEGYLQ